MGLFSRHKFVVIGILVVLVLAVWYVFSGGSSAPEQLVTSVPTTASGSPTQETADQQLVATLLTLRAVTLSGTIFQDPAFTSLRDFGTTIVAEPIGRTNPFAPLGATAAAATPIQAATTTRPATPTQLFQRGSR